MSTIPAPAEWLESVSKLNVPERTNRRMQALMDRNKEGQLSPQEPQDREELESLVEISESIAPVRAEALRLLGT